MSRDHDHDPPADDRADDPDDRRVDDEAAPGADPVPLHAFLGLSFPPPAPGEAVAEVRMPLTPNSSGHIPGNFHGGAIATMVDLACAVVAAQHSGWDPTTQAIVTTDLHVRYVGRARTDEVVARAEVLRTGRQLVVVECRVSDTDGRLVAAADLSTMLVPLASRLGHPG